MKTSSMTLGILVAGLSAVSIAAYAETPAGQGGKMEYGEYKDWPVLGVSHRTEKNTLRAIVGNEIAIKAARSGNTQPWPDGSIIAKVVWKQRVHPHWPSAIVPGEFSAAEAMVKDSKKYAETGGWGFGHWEGRKLVMNNKEKSAECFACHMPVKDADYVYTLPVYQ